jgi:hypothetical protein
MQGVNMLLGDEAVRKMRTVTRHGLAAGLQPPAKAGAGKGAAVRDREVSLCKNVRDDALRAALERLAAHVGNKK